MVNLVKGLLKKALPIGMTAFITAFMTWCSLFPFAKKSESITAKKNDVGQIEFFDDGQNFYKTNGINDETKAFFKLLKRKVKAKKEDKEKLNRYLEEGGAFYMAVENNPGAIIDVSRDYLVLKGITSKKTGKKTNYACKEFGIKNFGLEKYVKPSEELTEADIEAIVDETFAEETYKTPPKKEIKEVKKAKAKKAKKQKKIKEKKIREVKTKKIKEVKAKKVEKEYDSGMTEMIRELKEKHEKLKEAKEEPQYKIASKMRKQEIKEITDYVMYNNDGFEKKYLSIDDVFKSSSTKDVSLSELKKKCRPSTKYFKLSENEEIIDTLNKWTLHEGNKRGVYVRTKSAEDDTIVETRLLFKDDLNSLVHSYARSKERIGTPIKVLRDSYKQLRDRNVVVVKKLEGKKGSGIQFCRIPEEEDISGIAYVIEKYDLVNALDMDPDALLRAEEKKAEASLALWENASSFNFRYSNDGRISGKRFKFNVINEDNMLKQSQFVFSNTSKTETKNSIGFGIYQDVLGNYKLINETDVCFSHSSENKGLDLLIGTTEDEFKYDDTIVGNYILRQTIKGKTNSPMISGKAKGRIPGDLPLIKGRPSGTISFAKVDGNDVVDWSYSDLNNVVVSSGSTNISSGYTTVSFDLGDEFKLGKNTDLEVMAGAEHNNFSQEGENNEHSQSRFGVSSNYDVNGLKLSLMLMYQMNSNEGRAGVKNNIVGHLQAGFLPAEKLAVLLSGYYDGFNDAKEAGITVFKSPRHKKFIKHQTKLNRELYRDYAINTNSLLYTGVNKNLLDIQPIYEGVKAEVFAGNDKYGRNFSKALVDIYLGKKLGAGFEYEKKDDDTNVKVKIKKTF